MVKNLGETNSWSGYWARGIADSCPEHVSLYNHFFRKLWQKELSSIIDNRKSQALSNMKILDVATGNGVLAKFFIETKIANAVQITGIDKAKISPLKYSFFQEGAKHQVDFLSDISAENLPFEECSFDWVVSQFGIEYSELEQSISEVLRVLKNGGQWSFVCHFSESEIIKSNTKLLLFSKKLLSDLPLFLRLKEQIKLECKIKQIENKKSMSFKKTQQLIFETKLSVEKIIKQMLQTEGSERHFYQSAIFAAKEIYQLSQNLPLEVSIKKLNFALTELQSSIMRLKELVNASLSESRLMEVKKLFTEGGSEILGISQLEYQGRSVGIHLTGIKKLSIKEHQEFL